MNEYTENATVTIPYKDHMAMCEHVFQIEARLEEVQEALEKVTNRDMRQEEFIALVGSLFA